MYVLVSGLPRERQVDAGAAARDRADLPLFSKDTIKEALWDALGPGDRVWARQLGIAAVAALPSLVQSSSGAVVDHFLHADHLADWVALPGIVEVRCACATALSRERYADRVRHPSHFDADLLRDSFDAWIAEDTARPPVGPRLDVDTATPVDVASIASWVRNATQ